MRPFLLALPVLALAACSPGASGGGGDLTPKAKALIAELPARFHGADVEHGKTMFNVCRSCHTVIPGGASLSGPNLHEVWGAKAGERPGFAYSDALKATGWTWDADRLDRWLTDPQTAAPGTKMTFAGLNDAEDRRDVIAYLRLADADAAP